MHGRSLHVERPVFLPALLTQMAEPLHIVSRLTGVSRRLAAGFRGGKYRRTVPRLCKRTVGGSQTFGSPPSGTGASASHAAVRVGKNTISVFTLVSRKSLITGGLGLPRGKKAADEGRAGEAVYRPNSAKLQDDPLLAAVEGHNTARPRVAWRTSSPRKACNSMIFETDYNVKWSTRLGLAYVEDTLGDVHTLLPATR